MYMFFSPLQCKKIRIGAIESCTDSRSDRLLDLNRKLGKGNRPLESVRIVLNFLVLERSYRSDFYPDWPTYGPVAGLWPGPTKTKLIFGLFFSFNWLLLLGETKLVIIE